jgi:elongation of very long chain fatty acids protein 6
MPYLLSVVLSQPFQTTICQPSQQTWAFGGTGMWVMLMNFSKPFELFDTLFIVLRKKPLVFLHWYHHITVLLFCWKTYGTSENGSGMYFVAMNYTIHAVMYGYYCLSALRLRPKWFPAVAITMGQITQMVVGTAVCAAGWHYRNLGVPCSNDYYVLVLGALMYASYLYLFADFAVRKYVVPKKSKKTV